MIEDRFEEFLRETAQDYHRPPETPKAEIWARVEAARRTADRRPGGPRDEPEAGQTTKPPVLPSYRPTVRPSYRLALAIAAVLALGVAIGRLSVRPPAIRPGAAPVVVAPRPAAGSASPNVAYQVVATQHLSRVEALLTELKTEPAAANLAPQARDLLTTTRLLLDSPRITDPMLRSLLQDVELVLVQLAQLSPGLQAEERTLIDQGMTERQIRPRLRNAIPSGQAARIRGET